MHLVTGAVFRRLGQLAEASMVQATVAPSVAGVQAVVAPDLVRALELALASMVLTKVDL